MGSAALAATTLAAMLPLLGCAAADGHSRAPRTSASSTPSALGQSDFRLSLDTPSVTVTPAGLYLTWYRLTPSRSVTGEVLARADAATGVIMAQRDFSSGVVGAPLLADGSLWVTDSTPGGGATPSGDSTSGQDCCCGSIRPRSR
jgi:hypothetical protein